MNAQRATTLAIVAGAVGAAGASLVLAPAILYIGPLALGVTAVYLAIGTLYGFDGGRVPSTLRVLLLVAFIAGAASIAVGVGQILQVKEDVDNINQGLEDLGS